MLDLIIENKEWLFSGVLVAVPLAFIGWLCAKRSRGDVNIGSHNRAGRDQSINIGSLVRQPDSGDDDNAKRDKTTKV